jgi:hypothetical protein
MLEVADGDLFDLINVSGAEWPGIFGTEAGFAHEWAGLS